MERNAKLYEEVEKERIRLRAQIAKDCGRDPQNTEVIERGPRASIE